jgi:hypothetical protein
LDSSVAIRGSGQLQQDAGFLPQRRRCQHLEAEIAAVLAEYGREGRLSAETLERLEEQLLQPVPMEVVA